MVAKKKGAGIRMGQDTIGPQTSSSNEAPPLKSSSPPNNAMHYKP